MCRGTLLRSAGAVEALERWEPPKSTGVEAPRRRRPVIEPSRRDLPEIWLMVALRLGIVLVLLTTVVFEQLREHMSVVGLVLIVGLIAVLIQSDTEQTQKLRRMVIVDLTILLTIVPVAVLNGFVAAEPGDLLPAEQSSLLQTTGGLLISFAIVVWLTSTLFVDARQLLPSILLPGLLFVLVLTFVLHDYRNQTVLAMLTASYFVGAAAIALGSFVEESVQRYVPLAFYGATILAGLVLFDPGLGNVADREGMVQIFTGMMVLIGLAVLLVTPNPAFDNLQFGGPSRPPHRPRNVEQQTWRDSRDTSRETSK
jgi:hypothetical protein